LAGHHAGCRHGKQRLSNRRRNHEQGDEGHIHSFSLTAFSSPSIQIRKSLTCTNVRILRE
jgi:hypothetical protein